MIEGLEYVFDCTVEAGTSDPEGSIEWFLRDESGTPIDTEIDASGGIDDCTANEFTGQYTLTAARNTFAGLQCGYLECQAYNSVGTSTLETIYFQIWSKCIRM